MMYLVVYLALLCLAGLISVAVVRPNLPSRVPDIPIYLAVGMFFGSSGLGGALDLGNSYEAGKDYLRGLQFISLYLIVFTSCSGLRFARFHEQSAIIAILVFASFAAFFFALASVSYFDVLILDPQVAEISNGARHAHLLVLSLGVMVCSLPFLTKIFNGAGLQNSRFASNILLAACFVDIVVWAIFSVAVGLRNGGDADISSAIVEVLQSSGLFVSTIGVGIIVLNVMGSRLGNQSPLRMMLITLLLSGGIIFAAVIFEIGALLGMMIAGLALGTKPALFSESIATLERMSTSVGAPLYFTFVGFEIAFSTQVQISAVVIFVLWSSIIKIGTITAAANLVRQKSERALDYGIAMNTRGGPGLVLAAASYSEGLIDMTGFLALTAASILTAIGADVYMRRGAGRILEDRQATPHYLVSTEK